MFKEIQSHFIFCLPFFPHHFILVSFISSGDGHDVFVLSQNGGLESWLFEVKLWKYIIKQSELTASIPNQRNHQEPLGHTTGRRTFASPFIFVCVSLETSLCLRTNRTGSQLGDWCFQSVTMSLQPLLPLEGRHNNCIPHETVRMCLSFVSAGLCVLSLASFLKRNSWAEIGNWTFSLLVTMPACSVGRYSER